MNNYFVHALKYLIVTISCFNLFGCVSKVDNASEEHELSSNKWKTLAAYSGKGLQHYGVTITGQIKISKTNYQDNVLSLENIKLSKAEQNTDINLLSPQFISKFACGKECVELSRYEGSQTLLTPFFSSKEPEFFVFYSELLQINQNIRFYTESSPYDMRKYINWILSHNKVFNNLTEFTAYLKEYLQQDALLSFIKTGQISPNKLGGKYRFEELLSPNFDWRNSKPNLTGDEIIAENIRAEDEFQFNYTDMKMKVMRASKSRILLLGKTVCTFSDNSFGILKGINGDKVTIQLFGQARIIVDGINVSPDSGYLFTPNDSLFFVKKDDAAIYPRSDTYLCEFDSEGS